MKKKYFIIALTLIFISITVGVLCWGLQPVKKDEVSLNKLNKKLSDRYRMPSILPFEGDVKCYLIYNEQHWNLRFELSSNDVSGYSIELKDDMREIYIGSGTYNTFGISDNDGIVIENYKNEEIHYIFNTQSNATTDNLILQFDINSKTYQIEAKYNKDVDIEILESDIKCILEQMIH